MVALRRAEKRVLRWWLRLLEAAGPPRDSDPPGAWLNCSWAETDSLLQIHIEK
jgi:hypothetical protein